MRAQTDLEPGDPSVRLAMARNCFFKRCKVASSRLGELMSFNTSTLYLFATLVAGMLGAMLCSLAGRRIFRH